MALLAFAAENRANTGHRFVIMVAHPMQARLCLGALLSSELLMHTEVTLVKGPGRAPFKNERMI